MKWCGVLERQLLLPQRHRGHRELPLLCGGCVERDAVSGEVIGAAIAVHRALGPGLLESVYQCCLVHELSTRGIQVQRDVRVPICYAGVELEAHFRLDLLVAGDLIVELKSVERVLPVHTAQLLTYLKLTGHRRGLLLNFNVPRLMDGVTRIVR